MGMMRSILLLFIVAVAVAEADYYNDGPTICTNFTVDAQADAKILNQAIKSSNVTEIIGVLTKRVIYQRMDIARSYKEIYNVILIDEFKRVLHGNIRDLIVALMTSWIDYAVEELHDAIWHIGNNTDDDGAITEVLCGLNDIGYRKSVQKYQEKYNRSLVSDLKNGTSQLSLRRLFSARVAFQNKPIEYGDRNRIFSDAQKLNETGVYQLMGTDDSSLNESILVTRSLTDLSLIFPRYKRISHNNIEDAIKDKFSGNIVDGLLGFVKCLRGTEDYFADRLKASLAASGTDHGSLIRIIVLRSESDLKSSKDIFNKDSAKGESLQESIEKYTSGYYKDALLSLTEQTKPCEYPRKDSWDPLELLKKSTADPVSP